MQYRIAFGWYGGKYRHLNWLLPLLPYTNHFCEPYGASAAALINRLPSPVETYNDIDGELVNFFRVLRDTPNELIYSLSLTLFSREEYTNALSPSPDMSDLERARMFFIRAKQTRMTLTQRATKGRWQYVTTQSRRGMAGCVSKWLSGIEGLADVAERFLTVQIENAPAIEVIKRYDTPGTLFYCDPPYPHESRGEKNVYSHEMTDKDHRELSILLHNIQGKAAISGYACDLMDNLYGDWNYRKSPIKKTPTIFKERQEVLWANYDLSADFIEPNQPTLNGWSKNAIS